MGADALEDVDAEALAALEDGLAEASRRERGPFDGLLGSLPDGAPQALSYVLSYLRDFLLDKYPEAEARRLLEVFELCPGFRAMPIVPDDVELALSLLIGIRSAMRCVDDPAHPRHPDHFTKLIFGGVGVRDKKRRKELSEGGKARHANDPKAGAKAAALTLWKERRAGQHPKLRTNEQFAMECMRRWPELTSVAVITRWCTEWNRKENSPS